MEETLTLPEVFVVLVVAAVAFVIFTYWLRGAVLAQMAKKAKSRRFTVVHGGPRWIGPGFSRKQRRH